MTTVKPTVGVVIGRFQVPQLHKGHRHLIETALRSTDALLIVLGAVCGASTARNPLSADIRAAMVKKEYPEAAVLTLYDHPSDDEWSRQLDDLVEQTFPGHDPVLFASRDSFCEHYSGTHKVRVIEALGSHNGTAHRKRIAGRTLSSSAFRRGIIYAQVSRFPIAYPTVDIAILRPEHDRVLLAGKKMDGGKLRFIGGFVDPSDVSLEHAACREAGEETGHIETTDYTYVGSHKVDDWRYRGSGDGIITSLFTATYIFGKPRPTDDIDHLEWVPYVRILDRLVESHRPLGRMLLETLATHHEYVA